MMNKGLELIEAYHLFPVPEERIEIIVHPQSIVHSMVAYTDGSVLAQMGTPDMRTPIAYALAWPHRTASPAARLDLAKVGTLNFEAPDPVRFPALRLAREALQAGRGAPTVLNAANEVAVRGFLDGRIAFLDITRIVEQTLETMRPMPTETLDDISQIDALARREAERFMANGKV
jgi:1-deoxy-D-xylulose-5-phosphate reductoisomerase